MPRNYTRKSEKQLDRTNLEAAFKHRVATNCSIKAAALEFGVKKTTLMDAFNRSKKLSDGVTYVPVQAHSNRVFTPQQELHIMEYTIQTAKMFYGLPTNEVRRMVYQYAKACGSQTIPDAWEKDKMATRAWYYSFMDRHQSLQIKRLQNLSSKHLTYSHKNI